MLSRWTLAPADGQQDQSVDALKSIAQASPFGTCGIATTGTLVMTDSRGRCSTSIVGITRWYTSWKQEQNQRLGRLGRVAGMSVQIGREDGNLRRLSVEMA